MDDQTSKTLDYGVYYMEPEGPTPPPLRQRVADLEKQIKELQAKEKDQDYFINSHREWLTIHNQSFETHWRYIMFLEQEIRKLQTK